MKTANDTLKRKDEALQTATKTLLTANEILLTANEILKHREETLRRREEFFFTLRSKSLIGGSGIRFLFAFSTFSSSNFQLVV